MELVEDVAEDPGYVSCMFCTARCFKLHGHGVRSSSKGHGRGSSSSPVHGALPGPDGASGKHRTPFFVKTVKTTTVRRKNCELHLPAFFFRDYGDRFQKFVLLRGPSGQVWPVNLCVSCGSSTGRPTVRFSRGWNSFALDHDLELGDKLIFTLTSFSRFTVQVFDSFGKKKPTSSMAVSGWSFQREGLLDGVFPRQKRSFYVNWKEKVVRDSAAGNVEESKKGKVVVNRHTKTSLLYRHLKREEKKLERKSGGVVKYRARKPDKALLRPARLLGQKWIKQIGASFSEAEKFSKFQEPEGGDGGATKFLGSKMVKWEPLDNTAPLSLTWPSEPGNPVELPTPSEGSLKTGRPVMLGKAATPNASPPCRLSRNLEERWRTRQGEQSRRVGGCSLVDQGEEGEDSDLHGHSEELTNEMHISAPPDHTFQDDPVRALEGPVELDTTDTPASPTLSLSHYLEASPLGGPAQSNDGESFLVDLSQSNTNSASPRLAAGKRMKSSRAQSGGCSESPILLSEELVTFSAPEQTWSLHQGSGRDGSSLMKKRKKVVLSRRAVEDPAGITDFEHHLHQVDIPKSPSSMKHTPLPTLFSRGFPKDLEQRSNYHERCDPVGSYNPSTKRFSARNPSTIGTEAGTSLAAFNDIRPLGMSGASERPVSPTPTSTRSDLSLAYFLNQPRPKVRGPNHDDKGPEGRGNSSDDRSTQLPRSVGHQIDHPATTDNHLLEAGCSIESPVTCEIAALELTSARVGSPDGDEQTRSDRKSSRTDCQVDFPDEKFPKKPAKNPGKKNPAGIPAASSVNVSCVPVSLSSEIDASLSHYLDELPQKGETRSDKSDGRGDRSFARKKSCVANGTSETQPKAVFHVNPILQKDLTSTQCKRSPPAVNRDNGPTLPQKDVWISQYLERKRVAKEARKLKKSSREDGCLAEKRAAVNPAKSVAQRTKSFVTQTGTQCQTGSVPRIMRGQILNPSDSRASAVIRGEKVHKLRQTWSHMEQTRSTYKKVSSRDKCDLAELEALKSEDDEPAGGGREESWDAWMDIFRQNAVAS